MFSRLLKKYPKLKNLKHIVGPTMGIIMANEIKIEDDIISYTIWCSLTFSMYNIIGDTLVDLFPDFPILYCLYGIYGIYKKTII